MKKVVSLILAVLLVASMFAGCKAKKETVTIYSCANDKRIAHITEVLQAKFPQYDIIVEYQGTSKLAAKLLAEGKATDADIIHDMLSLNMDALNEAGILADVSFIDTSVFLDNLNISKNYVPECVTSGAVIVNNAVLKAKNLTTPTSFEDLLKPEYKGLISMPDPKASGTGYMFFKFLVNAWGEQKALQYFKDLSVNVLQFTSSGNGPVNALMQQEVAIGLGMTMNAVEQLDGGADLSILFFEEGAPMSLYCQSVVAGKEENAAVKEVFEYMVKEYMDLGFQKFGGEQVFKDKTYTSKNYPTDIVLADMGVNTLAEKERLLALWDIT